MTRRSEPWATYAQWLAETRALNPTTISTYLTLARRVLRHAGTPLTSDGVGAWIESLPVHHRSPHRAAYRAFAEWSAAQGHPIPAIPVRTADLSDEAIDALDAFVRGGIPIRAIPLLVWDVDDSPAKRAAFPDRIFLRVGAAGLGDYAVVPRDAAGALRRWAYGDAEVGATDPVVPRAPGSKDPIASTVLARLLRLGR